MQITGKKPLSAMWRRDCRRSSNRRSHRILGPFACRRVKDTFNTLQPHTWDTVPCRYIRSRRPDRMSRPLSMDPDGLDFAGFFSCASSWLRDPVDELSDLAIRVLHHHSACFYPYKTFRTGLHRRSSSFTELGCCLTSVDRGWSDLPIQETR
jgi:hypothetical protein